MLFSVSCIKYETKSQCSNVQHTEYQNNVVSVFSSGNNIVIGLKMQVEKKNEIYVQETFL